MFKQVIDHAEEKLFYYVFNFKSFKFQINTTVSINLPVKLNENNYR